MPTITSYVPNSPWKAEHLFLDADNVPVDITGATFRMHVRTNLDSNVILTEASTANGKITITPITATYQGTEVTGDGIRIELDAADTLAIYQACANAVADLEVTFPDNTVCHQVLEFIFEVDKTVTRDF